MKIGIGLPNPVPGTPGTRLVEWAKRAEDRGFSGLATIDRLAYPSYDSLATLAAAAGATTRIELLTNVLLAPLYPAPLLAKTTASIDQLSDGRLTLGLAPGGRADDFEIAARDFHTRGRDFDRVHSPDGDEKGLGRKRAPARRGPVDPRHVVRDRLTQLGDAALPGVEGLATVERRLGRFVNEWRGRQITLAHP